MSGLDEDELCFSSATELAERIHEHEVSPSEVAEAFLARVERVNPTINALVYHDPERVRERARRLTKALFSGEEPGLLHGVPYTVKDLTAVAGIPLTLGLVPLARSVPDRNAVVVDRMEEAGGLFLGKTNTSESGYCAVTDNHLFGATENPWRPGRTAGGSSGGAAAAVAAGLSPLAEGSDGAGSVRIPASVNGVVGHKPSVGRIPQTILGGRFNTWAFHGPLTRTVADAALMLSNIAGPDPADPLSLPDFFWDFVTEIKIALRAPRVAWSPDLGFGAVDPEIAEICRQAVGAFEELGCLVEKAHPGWQDPEQAMWDGIWTQAFAAEKDMLDWEAWRGQVDDNLIALIEEGAAKPGIDIARADAVRGAMWDRFAAFMERYDLLVTPTVTMPTFSSERFCPEALDGRPLRTQLLGWFLTYPFNMVNAPAISVPAGFTREGMPVGIQIVGGLHADADVLRAAAAYERVRPWADERPGALTPDRDGRPYRYGGSRLRRG